MTDPTFPYQGVLVRDSLNDNGTSPSSDVAYESPDIIPYGAQLLSLATAMSTYGETIGRPLSTGTGSVNNIFVRAKNLNPEPETATVALYYARASLLNAPAIGGAWKQLNDNSGRSEVPLVGSGGTQTLTSQAIALTDSAFALNGLVPPPGGDHYCLMAIVQAEGFTITVPSSWPTNSAFSNWVQTNPAVGWKNVAYYTQTSNAFSATYQFGNLNSTAEQTEFIISTEGPYLPADTTITLTCTSNDYPFRLAQIVSDPPTSGRQSIPFIPSTNTPPNFAGAVTLEIQPPTGISIPSGVSIRLGYYQIPNPDIALDLEMARDVTSVDETGVQTTHNLVALGAVNVITL